MQVSYINDDTSSYYFLPFSTIALHLDLNLIIFDPNSTMVVLDTITYIRYKIDYFVTKSLCSEKTHQMKRTCNVKDLLVLS